MKTLNQKLIAFTAAVVFTTASLSAVNYNVAAQPTAATEINGLKVTTLPAVNVQPDARSLSPASLLNDIGVAAFAALPMGGLFAGRSGEASGVSRPSRLGPQLAMPYYSFGYKFGHISKD